MLLSTNEGCESGCAGGTEPRVWSSVRVYFKGQLQERGAFPALVQLLLAKATVVRFNKVPANTELANT